MGCPKASSVYGQVQWHYFFARPDLRAKYAEKEAHKTQAAGGGPIVAYRHLPKRKHPLARGRAAHAFTGRS